MLNKINKKRPTVHMKRIKENRMKNNIKLYHNIKNNIIIFYLFTCEKKKKLVFNRYYNEFYFKYDIIL